MENFNELAANWDNEPRRVQRAKIVAEQLVAKISGLQELEGFEYGCGTGLLSFFLQPHLKKILLGDSSEGMLKVLQEKIDKYQIGNMEPLLLDLTTDSLPAIKCDLLYTLMTLHHIKDTDKILGAFHELIRPEGYLCIVDLDKEDGTFHDKDFDGHCGFDRGDLKGQLDAAGFNVLSDEICYNNTKIDSDGIERVYPLFIMICKKKKE